MSETTGALGECTSEFSKEHLAKTCGCTFLNETSRSLENCTVRFNGEVKFKCNGFLIDNCVVTGQLYGVSMDYFQIRESTLRDLRLRGGMLRPTIHQTKIINTQIGSDLRDGRFHGVYAQNLKLTNNTITQLAAHECTFEHACFRVSAIENSKFFGCRFEQSDFSCATLQNVHARGSIFVGSKFNSDRLKSCEIKHTDLSMSSMKDCEFRSAVFIQANFDGAQIDSCNFRLATLNLASFIGASFTQVAFNGAQMNNANFDGATFLRCSFDYATVESANFRGAKLIDCTFKNSKFNSKTIWPEGFAVPGHSVDMDKRALAIELATKAASEKLPSGAAFVGPVFVPSPYKKAMASWVYALYPTLFEILCDDFAFSFTRTGQIVMKAFENLNDSLRVGDGVMPFASQIERMECIAVHMGASISEPVLHAQAELHDVNAGYEHKLREFIEESVKKSFVASRRKAKKEKSHETAAREPAPEGSLAP